MAGGHKVIGKPQFYYGHHQWKFAPSSAEEFRINLILDLYITFTTRQRNVSDLVKEQVEQEGCQYTSLFESVKTIIGGCKCVIDLNNSFHAFKYEPHFRSKVQRMSSLFTYRKP